MNFVNTMGIRKMILALILAGILISCESPFEAGLGPRVDITPPVLEMVEPSPGAFIKGKGYRFAVRAVDDIGVDSVNISFRRQESDAGDTRAMTLEPAGDDKEALWVYYLDTTDSATINGNEIIDGDLLVTCTALDESGKKSSTDILSYTIKNRPPRISMNQPLLAEDFYDSVGSSGGYYLWPSKEESPQIYMGTDLIGNVFDAQGVLAPYPDIKMWDPNKGESEDSAAWMPMDEYLGSGSWAGRNPDERFGTKSIGFRYFMVSGSTDREAGKNALGPNSLPYKYRLRAYDTGAGENRLISYFPPLNYPAAEAFVIVSEGPPALRVYFDRNTRLPDFTVPVAPGSLASQPPYMQEDTGKQKFTKDPFVIEARASHGSGIRRAVLEVVNRSQNPAPPPEELAWAQGPGSGYNTGDPAGSMAADPRWVQDNKGAWIREYLFLSPPISKGAVIPKAGGGTYTFEEGEYEFTVKVYTSLDPNSTQYTEHSFLVRINNKAPAIDISLSPNTEEIAAAGNPFNGGSPARYTVNGHVNVNWSADPGAAGFMVDESPGPSLGKQLKKYLVRDKAAYPSVEAVDESLFAAGTLLESSPLHFDTLNPVSALHAPDGAPKSYYLYIMAQDRSGMIGGAVSEIRVDQRFDLPKIVIERQDPAVDEQGKMLDTASSPGRKLLKNAMAGGAAIRATLEDDDGIDTRFGDDLGDPNTGIVLKLFKADGVELKPGTSPAKPNLPDLSSFMDRKTVDLNYNLSALPEGIYSYSLEVKDSAVKKNQNSQGNPFPAVPDAAPAHGARSTDLKTQGGNSSGRVWFVIDRNPPELRARDSQLGTSLSDGLSYNAIAPFPLTLEAGDAVGLSLLRISQKSSVSGRTISLPDTDLYTAYSVPGSPMDIPVSGLPRDEADPANPAANPRDGVYEYAVTLIDKTGQELTKRYIFKLDTGSPVIRTIAHDLPYLTLSGTDEGFTITGKVRDRGDVSAVSHVYWTLTTGIDLPAASMLIPASAAGPGLKLANPDSPPSPWFKGAVGGEDWSIRITRAGINAVLNNLLGAAGEEGRFFLHVAARDSAGNLSRIKADLNDRTAGRQNWPGAPPAGAAIADTAADIGRVEIYLDARNPALVWNKSFVYDGTNHGSLTSADQNLAAMMADTDGNRHPFSPDLIQDGDTWHSRGSFSFTFTALDTYALRDLRITRNGVLIMGGGLQAISDANTNAVLSYRYSGGPAGSAYIPPSADSTPGTGDNALSISHPAAANPVIVTALKGTISQNGLADGEYVYEISAGDFVNRAPPALARFKVKVDTKNPIVKSVDVPAFITGSGFTASGEAADQAPANNMISGVYWRLSRGAPLANLELDKIGPDGAPIGAAWNTGNVGGNAWTAAVSGLPGEGLYYFYVTARDTAGNLSALLGDHRNGLSSAGEAGMAKLYVDTRGPEIVWTPGWTYDGSAYPQAADLTMGAAAISVSSGGGASTSPVKDGDVWYTQNGFTLKFTALDSFALRNVRISRNGVDLPLGGANTVYRNKGASVAYAAPSADSTPGTGDNALSISHPAAASPVIVTDLSAALDETALPEGSYHYVIAVTDFVGNTKTAAFTIVVDKRNPVIGTIAAPAYITGAAFTATGTAKDPAGLSRITHVYYADPSSGAGDTAAPPAPPASGDPANPPAPWKAAVLLGENTATREYAWQANITLPNVSAEGVRYFHVIARDASGRLSTVSTGSSANNWPGDLDETNGGWKARGYPETGIAGIYVDRRDPDIIWDPGFSYDGSSYPRAGDPSLSMGISALGPGGKVFQNGNLYYTNSPFSISFTALDSFALRTVEVKRNGADRDLTGDAALSRRGFKTAARDSYTAIGSGYVLNSGVNLPGETSPGDSLSNPPANIYVTDLKAVLNENPAADGAYTYKITVTDFVGRKREAAEFTVILDRKNPVIKTIEVPSFITSPSFSARGKLWDQDGRSPVTHAYWAISNSAAPPSLTGLLNPDGSIINPAASPWKAAVAGGDEWNAFIDSNALPSTAGEGSVYFHAAARDAAGNISALPGVLNRNNWGDNETEADWVSRGKPETGKAGIYIDLREPEMVWDAEFVYNPATGNYPGANDDSLNLYKMAVHSNAAKRPFSAPGGGGVSVDNMGYYTRGPFDLSFTALDSFALRSVRVEWSGPVSGAVDLSDPSAATVIRGGTGTGAAGSGYLTSPVAPPGGGGVLPSLSDPAGAKLVTSVKVTLHQNFSADGAYACRISVTDFVGKVKAYPEFTIVVDTAPPAIAFTATSAAAVINPPEPGSVGSAELYIVNGVFQVSAAVSDGVGLGSSKWWLLPRANAAADSDQAPAWTDTTAANGTNTAGGRLIYAGGTGVNSVSAVIDTIADGASASYPATSGIPDGHYTLYVMARDKAGNEALAKRYIRVDQDSDNPRVTVGNPLNNDFVRPEDNLRLSLGDDDNIASITIESGTSASGPWTGLSGSPVTLNPPRLDYNYSASLASLGLNGDGVKYLRITAADHPGSKIQKDKERGAKSRQVFLTFTVDDTKPVIAFGGSPPYNYREAAAFSLAGTINEANLDDIEKPGSSAASPRIKWTVDEGGAGKEAYLAVTGTAPAHTWSLSYAGMSAAEQNAFAAMFNALPQGTHTLRIDAVDKAGNTDSNQVIFTKDTVAPEIQFSSIKEVGNFPNPYPSAAPGLNPTIIKGDPADALTIQGSFIDQYSYVGSAPYANFYYRFDTDTPSAPADTFADTRTKWRSAQPESSGAANSRWTIPLPQEGTSYNNGSLNDGRHRLWIRAADMLGNHFENSTNSAMGHKDGVWFILDRHDPVFDPAITVSPAAAGNVYGASAADPVITLSGKAYDANIRKVSAVLSTSPETSLANMKPALGDDAADTANPKRRMINWEFRITQSVWAALADGVYTITISAVDDADREAKTSWTFTKDAAPPEITISNANPSPYGSANPMTVFVDAAPKINGSATDNMGLANTPAQVSAHGVRYRIGNFDYIANSWSAGAWTALPLTGNPTSLSWSVPLESGGQALPDGLYRIEVQAQDRNGNSSAIKSADFFIDRKDPVIDLPGYNAATAPNGVRSIYRATAITLSGTMTELNDLAVFKAYIYRNSTGAKYPWTEVAMTGWSGVFGSGGSFSGALSPAPIAGVRNITQTANAAQHLAAWTVTLPWQDPANSAAALDAGELTLVIAATDNAGRTRTIEKVFTFDPVPPVLTINNPPIPSFSAGNYVYPTRVNGRTLIIGETKDNDRVEKLYYHLGNINGTIQESDWIDTMLDTNSPARDSTYAFAFSGGLYAWTLTFDNADVFAAAAGIVTEVFYDSQNNPNTPPVPQAHTGVFRLPIYIRAVDRAGNNASITNYYILVDPSADEPQVEFYSPNNAAVLGGQVRVTGSAVDDDWIQHVQMRVGVSALISSDNPSDWYFDSAASRYYYKPYASDPAYAVPPPSGKWDYRSKIDSAKGWFNVNIMGNLSSSVSWYFNINQKGELNPQAGNRRNVWVEVKARDSKDFGNTDTVLDIFGPAKTLYIQFDSTVPQVEIVSITRPDGVHPYTPGIRVAGTFKVRAEIKDDGGIATIKYRGQEKSIYTSILDIKDTTMAAPPGVTLTLPPVMGASQFKRNVKYFLISNSSTDFVSAIGQDLQPGNTFLWTAATGSGSGNARAYEADYGGGVPPAAADQFFKYTVEIEINSDNIEIGAGNYAYRHKSGVYGMDLQAMDNTEPLPYLNQTSVNVQIDNFYPTGRYTSAVRASSANYYLQGRAIDTASGSGSIQGLDYVALYFSRGGTFIPLADNPAHPAYAGIGSWQGTARQVKPMPANGDQSVTPLSKTFPVISFDAKGKPRSSNSGIVINDNEVNIDLDGDGFVEGWSDDGPNKDWYARFDTTRFKDGPITLHYVIVDQAGNASYYEQNLFIQNNAPRINSLRLGTDINFDGVVSGVSPVDPGSKEARTVSTNYQSTNFRVRNKRLSLNIDVSGGNGIRYYKVGYVTGTGQVKADKLVRGNYYTISSLGATDWTLLGAASNTVGESFLAAGAGADLGTNTGVAASYTLSEKNAAPLTGSTLKLDDAAFGASPLIADSGTNGARFIIKVYDSTIPGGSEADQLADAVMLCLTVENDDTHNPELRVAEFGGRYFSGLDAAGNVRDQIFPFNPASSSFAAYYRENVVSGTGTDPVKYGHVQYKDHKPTGAGAYGTANLADLSGKVIFLGKAWDDQRITRITAAIPGYNGGAEFVIARWDTAAHKLAAANAANGSVAALATESAGAPDWAFEIVEEPDEFEVLQSTQDFTEVNGHFLNWKFAFDTSRISGKAALNQRISFKAYDGRNYNANSASPPFSGNSAGKALNVDIVPYIQEIVTRLNSAYRSKPSAFNRSTLGSYPVQENEVIEIRGFNLNGSGTTVRVNNTNLSGVAVPGGQNPAARITANVGTAAVSGPLTVVVNSIESTNNKNNDNKTTAPYNQEPNGVNNNLLNDDRSLSVWSTGALINETNLTSPFLRMDSASNMYLSVGRGNTDMYFWKNGAFQSNPLEQCYNKYHHTTVAFDSSGQMYGAATNTDRIGDTVGQATSFTFYMRQTGTNWVFPMGNYKNGGNRRHLELSFNGSTGVYDINRVEIPRMAVIGAGTAASEAKIYMSYYDGNNNSHPVKFRYGTVGQYTGNPTGGIAYDLTDNNPGSASGYQVVADNSTAYKGGRYTAVGALSDGRAVIAWYDASTSNLMYSYSPTTNPGSTTTAQWQANAKVIDGPFAGWHVDLTVDGGNGIHIAYYNSDKGGLSYAYLSSYNAQPQTVDVDNFLSPGTKIMINTRRETKNSRSVYVPYISYYHASFPQTMNSIRVAWRTDWTNPAAPSAGVDAKDLFTGNWEVMTIPTGNIPVEDFVCNGVPSTGTVNAGPFRGVNLTNSIMLSYFTNRYYEGAYLKK